jgi:predicted nuclease with TOPRIM domain
VAKANDLKALQIKEKNLDSEELVLLQEKVKIQEQLNKVSQKKASIKKQIENLTKDFTVSEHALLRYIEKTYNINLNDISNNILKNESLEKYDFFGNGEYPLNKGLKAVIKDKVIVTIK